MTYWFCLFVVVLPLLLENALLRRWRDAVPVRVHIHGTRGKTGTVRALARALSQRGCRVLAKTTGDAPQYLLPDGSSRAIRRWGPARIQEHVDILRLAAHLRADAVVVEGMALQPETVFQSEKILRATHAIVVNARSDHQETMGPGRRGVLRTLGLMLPERGKLYTAREQGAAILRGYAEAAGIPCSIVPASPMCDQGDALAVAVAAEIDSDGRRWSGRADDRDDHAAVPIGNLGGRIVTLEVSGVTVRFYDFYSANDVASARIMWGAQAVRNGDGRLRVALLATRADRPLRTRAFMDWLCRAGDFDMVAPAGDHAWYALLHGASAGRQARQRLSAVACPWTEPRRVLDRLCRCARERGVRELVVAGLGNAHGFGLGWRRMVSRLEAS